jgi:hypothetical protein
MPRRLHIFAVAAVALLRRVGPFVLNYLLRAFDGRLSELVRHMRSFADRRFPGRPPEAAMLEAFVGETFGADHHLTSLVRFALRVNEGGGERSMPADAPPPAFDPAASYRLGPTVRLLADIHDCEALLARIAEDAAGTELLPESEAGERVIYLLMRTGRTVTPHRIDPGVAAILSLFEQPRRVSDVARAVCDATGIAELPSEFFADLVRARIIEPCVPRSGAVEPIRETAALAVTDA